MKSKKSKQKFKENPDDVLTRRMCAFFSYVALLGGNFAWAFVFFIATLICYMLRETKADV